MAEGPRSFPETAARGRQWDWTGFSPAAITNCEMLSAEGLLSSLQLVSGAEQSSDEVAVVAEVSPRAQ